VGKFDTKVEMILCISGDGNVSFEEFVEIVSNMGATTDRTADQEEKELRDAFRVSE
jgi:Ca2+-binding EF-hand superfamily protein